MERIPVGLQRQCDERGGVSLGGLCDVVFILIERFAVRKIFREFVDELLLLPCGWTVIRDDLHPLTGSDVLEVAGRTTGALDVGTLEDQLCHSSSS